VKSTVKCYKKKTKKTVNGKKKTYQYNQYLVPLKRSDNLECKLDVFIIPKEDLEDMLDEEENISEEILNIDYYKQQIGAYKKEFSDLEWKHGQLSRTYKELVSKNTKMNQKWRKFESEIEELHLENQKLSKDLEVEKKRYQNLKDKFEELDKKDVVEDISKEKADFWSVFRKKDK
jgi:chromosome segregation ATPase